MNNFRPKVSEELIPVAGRVLGYFAAVGLWIFLSMMMGTAGASLAGLSDESGWLILPILSSLLLGSPVVGTMITIIQTKRGRGYWSALGQATLGVMVISLLFSTSFYKWIF